MSRRTLLMAAPLGLGGLVLLWAALAARSQPDATPSRATPKPAAARKPSGAETVPLPEPSTAAPFVAAPTPAAAGGGENALIEERVRKMEERLLALEVKRNTLAGANQELERQVLEKTAETSARMMAEWRVRNLDQQLGLSETQKQTLTDLWAKWNREDAGKAAGRETWLSREQDLRSQLSAEQAAKMHETAVQQTQTIWNSVGRSIAHMVGASKEDQTRFQQTMGDFPAANAMLLPEGYGADWAGMMREGSSRLKPLLSQDQMTKLNRFVPR
ncbi:MAG TPA: hypothetical protein VNM14_22180 [Planctomycetota bacterium]|jgi:hypothetical protein|nr:hypothetical protein [Planctomycetota bacterium]